MKKLSTVARTVKLSVNKETERFVQERIIDQILGTENSGQVRIYVKELSAVARLEQV